MTPALLWVMVRVGGWDTWYPAAQLIAFTPYAAEEVRVLRLTGSDHRPLRGVLRLP